LQQRLHAEYGRPDEHTGTNFWYQKKVHKTNGNESNPTDTKDVFNDGVFALKLYRSTDTLEESFLHLGQTVKKKSFMLYRPFSASRREAGGRYLYAKNFCFFDNL